MRSPYTIKTITLNNIIQKYNINPFEISLIKVDIEGKEEDILSELYDIHIKYGATLFINFNYNKWNDKNIDRFSFLSLRATEIIRTYASCYILF